MTKTCGPARRHPILRVEARRRRGVEPRPRGAAGAAARAGVWLRAALLVAAILYAWPSLTACSLLGSEETGGVFMRLGYAESTGLRVADVPEGPAREAGLREDDRVTRIDGDDVSRMPMREIVERLRGPVGSTVELEVVRDGEFHTFVVRRAAYEREGR